MSPKKRSGDEKREKKKHAVVSQIWRIHSREKDNVAQTKRQKTLDAGYGPDSKLWNSILMVDGQKLHVSKEVLMLSSPVFQNLFTSSFKETQTNPPTVKLPGKPLQSVLWLLDYLYPDRPFEVTDENAVDLLPLADEYQIQHLMQLCKTTLLEQVNPRLEVITLAEQYDLQELWTQTISACAEHVDPSEVMRQKDLPVNKPLTDKSMFLLYEKKLEMTQKLISDVKRRIWQLRNQSYYSCDTTKAGKETIATLKTDLQRMYDKIRNNEDCFGEDISPR